ncbi:hypothetical protein K502DRAFT_349517 [Neoconidiobolus thromboides FSU 785]|nr:hypothetical protein K502DRAFT_349517 [Neoconidiobolus thromboides FSU 785]
MTQFEIESITFRKERQELIDEIDTSLNRIIGTMNIFNSNLEALADVGSEFKEASSMWEKFMTETVKTEARKVKTKMDPFRSQYEEEY